MRLSDYIKHAVKILPEVENYLTVEALKLIRRRDRREPGRRIKENFEEQIAKLVNKRFARQKKKLFALITQYTGRKTMLPPIDLLFESDEEEEEFYSSIVVLLTKAIREGIGLLAADVSMQIDWTITNQEAADFARSYAFELVKNIDATTRTILQRAVTSFIETPGMTLGQLADLLPFTEQRAFTIAVTEVTRAFAQGQKIAGVALGREFRGIRMMKTWYTNMDDRVCDICAPLDGQTVPLDEPFYSPGGGNDGDPPAHVNCRCWISIETRIEE